MPCKVAAGGATRSTVESPSARTPVRYTHPTPPPDGCAETPSVWVGRPENTTRPLASVLAAPLQPGWATTPGAIVIEVSVPLPYPVVAETAAPGTAAPLWARTVTVTAVTGTGKSIRRV